MKNITYEISLNRFYCKITKKKKTENKLDGERVKNKIKLQIAKEFDQFGVRET